MDLVHPTHRCRGQNSTIQHNTDTRVISLQIELNKMSLGLAGDDDNDNDDDDDDNESKRAVVMNWWQLRLRDQGEVSKS